MIGALLAALQAELVAVEAVAVAADERILGLCAGDLDGDGREDLVLAIEDAAEVAHLVARTRGEDGRLRAAAAWRQRLPADVTAFALGDLTADPGREVLLLGGTGAFALVPSRPENERFERLAGADFLLQVRAPGRLPAWTDALVDLDGDGLEDLLLPEPRGFVTLLQRRGADGAVWSAAPRARLPRRPDADLGSVSIRLGLRPAVSVDEPSTLVRTDERSPTTWVVDWTGDGRDDVVLLDVDRLWIWPGGADEAEPTTLDLPLPVDLARRLDVSWAVHLGDVAGDGALDVVLVARDQKSERDRSQVLVYTERAAGLERPSQVLVVDGLVTGSELVDVDGDGRLDLVVTAIRQDFLDTLTAGGGERVEFDLYVYPSRAGRLARVPALRHRVAFDAGVEDASIEFCADATGDGVRELLLRGSGERVELLWVRARGEAWSVPSPSLWRYGVAKDARLVPLPGAAAGRAFALVEPGQATLLRIGR